MCLVSVESVSLSKAKSAGLAEYFGVYPITIREQVFRFQKFYLPRISANPYLGSIRFRAGAKSGSLGIPACRFTPTRSNRLPHCGTPSCDAKSTDRATISYFGLPPTTIGKILGDPTNYYSVICIIILASMEQRKSKGCSQKSDLLLRENFSELKLKSTRHKPGTSFWKLLFTLPTTTLHLWSTPNTEAAAISSDWFLFLTISKLNHFPQNQGPPQSFLDGAYWFFTLRKLFDDFSYLIDRHPVH